MKLIVMSLVLSNLAFGMGINDKKEDVLAALKSLKAAGNELTLSDHINSDLIENNNDGRISSGEVVKLSHSSAGKLKNCAVLYSENNKEYVITQKMYMHLLGLDRNECLNETNCFISPLFSEYFTTFIEVNPLTPSGTRFVCQQGQQLNFQFEI